MIKDLVEQIPEADFDIASDDSQGQVEIIGWLYQYYNQEPHHEVIDINGGPVKEHDIPAATQLFTTDWVVRYMVDNSLGRYYLEHAPGSQLADQLKYLLPGELHPVDSTVDLSELHVLDNAMGSGHILVYAFDVLMKIYGEQGFSQREAAQQIATENLFGLEIDKRAYQLAYFAIMMKVRQYDRRALRRELKLNLYVFEDSKNLNDEFLAHLPISEDDRSQLTEIREVFLNAKTLGSIMHIDHQFDIKGLLSRLDSSTQDISDNLFVGESNLAQLYRMLKVVEVMQSRYEVVVTNPPYLNKMNKTLKDYVKKYYKAYSGDLFSVFIWLNINMTVKNGYAAYMTPMVWMFIKTFENLRTTLLDNYYITNLIQMETHAFFDEAFVTIDSFVLQNAQHEENIGSYVRLTEFTGGMKVQEDRTLDAISDPNINYFYRANQAMFTQIPESPIAYWFPLKTFRLFKILPSLDSVVALKAGLSTGNNDLFQRRWQEVSIDNISFNTGDVSETKLNNVTWYPFRTGGDFIRWYSRNEIVVDWKNDGKRIRKHRNSKNNIASAARNVEYYFKQGITWTKLSSSKFGVKFAPTGYIFDDTSRTMFPNPGVSQRLVMGILNSKIAFNILQGLNPSMSFTNGDLKRIPILTQSSTAIDDLVDSCIKIVESYINQQESSWLFQVLPMLRSIVEHTLSLLRKIAHWCAHVPKMCQRIIRLFKRSVC